MVLTQVDQNGNVHGTFSDRKRWKNGYFTAANQPYYSVILGTVIRYRIRRRIPRKYGPYFCARYDGANTIRIRTVSFDLGSVGNTCKWCEKKPNITANGKRIHHDTISVKLIDMHVRLNGFQKGSYWSVSLLGPTSIDFFSFSFLSSLRLFFVIPGHDIISSDIIVITFFSFPSLEMISSHFSFFSFLSSPLQIYTCVFTVVVVGVMFIRVWFPVDKIKKTNLVHLPLHFIS